MKTLMSHIALLIVTLLASALSAQSVNVTFNVKPPPTTPADAKLYITGDAPALKLWAAEGVELKRNADGSYAAVIALPRNIPVEYKVTRGSWETVEKNADGSELANRTLTPTRDTTVGITVAAWGDKPAPAPAPAQAPDATAPAPPTQPQRRSTRSGDIRVHENFHSEHLNNDRPLYVYLPLGYESNADQRYPVLYMHDGQNIFDSATNPLGGDEWRADETAERLIKTGKIEPLIIVGISNTPARIAEYTLAVDERMKQGGSGEAYMRFVTEGVKPFIDKTYRTKDGREHTGTAGSSLGATISLDLCRAYPQVFGKCAAVSPALWWANGDLPRRIGADHDWVKKCRIWMDIGTAEGPPEGAQQLVNMVNVMANILRNAGAVDGKNFQLEIVRGAQHDERAWAARFDRVLMFLYPRSL